MALISIKELKKKSNMELDLKKKICLFEERAQNVSKEKNKRHVLASRRGHPLWNIAIKITTISLQNLT